jgi:peptide/nickel transport system substrate-binding protein
MLRKIGRLTYEGENMKARLKTRSIVAAVSAVSVALIGFVAVPAHAATRSTAVVIESNTFTSINNLTPDTNIVINGDVAYLTGMGLYHYDDKLNIVNNPTLGSYRVSRSKPGDFEVTYKIADGRVWSDGAPITAVDLLLSHVISSADYAKAAGLPDPNDPKASPTFNSGLYGAVYDQHIVGIPTVSADKMSMTVRYDSAIPDYALNGPGLTLPVHALELLAAGKKSLGSAAENAAATAKFLSDVNSKNTAALKAMGDVYSTGYNCCSLTMART